MGLLKSFSITTASLGLMFLAAAPAAKAVTLQYEGDIGRPANLAQGEFPGIPGTLAVPQGIGVQDSTGLIYISNGRFIDRVDIFDSQGNYVRGIGSTGSGPGQFDEPADLKFHPLTGELHVGDVFNSRINVFNPNTGEYIRSYGSFGGPVEGRIFFGPGGMSFDQDGNLYITDFSADVIKKYDGTTGELIKTIGEPGNELGQFLGPAGLSVSPNTGRIYVTDQYNNRVQVLDPEGNSLFAFGEPGRAPGQLSEAIGIEIDEYENIYVADSINSRVQVFDQDGNFLSAFGEPARTSSGEVVPPPALGGPPYGNPLVLEPGTFNWTAGLHYDDDKLYVGDFFQGRVQVLSVNRASVPEPSSLLGLVFVSATAVVAIKKQQKQKAVISLDSELEKTAV
jgi:DNA-binding beta-propeller fold protein YncE